MGKIERTRERNITVINLILIPVYIPESNVLEIASKFPLSEVYKSFCLLSMKLVCTFNLA